MARRQQQWQRSNGNGYNLAVAATAFNGVMTQRIAAPQRQRNVSSLRLQLCHIRVGIGVM